MVYRRDGRVEWSSCRVGGWREVFRLCIGLGFAAVVLGSGRLCFGAEGIELPVGIKEQRDLFREQELITGQRNSYVFNSGKEPRIVWRDADLVRALGTTEPLRIRWFDSDLNEATTAPMTSGWWGAYIESTAPNGGPLRRSMSFLCRPKNFFWYTADKAVGEIEHLPGPIRLDVWNEHGSEIRDVFVRADNVALNDSERGSVLIAGLAGAKPLGRPAKPWESSEAWNEQLQLGMKLKVLGRDKSLKGLRLPKRIDGNPAPVLREGSAKEAGFKDNFPADIAKVCSDWGRETTSPFCTLVARNGVIVYLAANGNDNDGKPVGLDFRAGVASITKSISGMLFAQFVDQGLIDPKASISTVFDDFRHFPKNCPNFTQVLNHTAGFSGHGVWGGVKNPWFDNYLLNGVDLITPGERETYAGANYDLLGKAMELTSGRTCRLLLREQLFDPLGIGDVRYEDMGAGANPTAMELGVLGQMLLNRGKYGNYEFFSEETFLKMLPEPVPASDPTAKIEPYGYGLNYKPQLIKGRELGSKNPADYHFSLNTIGHGSITQCLFRVDLDNQLVVVQIRPNAGTDYDKWSEMFLTCLSDNLIR